MLSIVIPLLNEAESLETLHHELHEVAQSHGYELDIIFVDDGSSDGSWPEIMRLAAEDPQVRGGQTKYSRRRIQVRQAVAEKCNGSLTQEPQDSRSSPLV